MDWLDLLAVQGTLKTQSVVNKYPKTGERQSESASGFEDVVVTAKENPRFKISPQLCRHSVLKREMALWTHLTWNQPPS